MTDLEFTPEQQLLFFKLEKAKTEYITKTKEKQASDKGTMKLWGIDFLKVSPTVKMLYFLVVFAVFILGVLYLLSKVMKKEEKKKKKKN
jgi:hypothetical protein